MSALDPMYGRLRNAVTSTTPEVKPDNDCTHPRRLERIDEWTEPEADTRFETCITRTVCLGCDTTTGYIRVRRAVRASR